MFPKYVNIHTSIVIMTKESKYRQLAKVFLIRLNEAKLFFNNHKPSIGFVGEYILRESLHTLMSQSYGICQGFVVYKEQMSRQCDVIIYKKGQYSINKSYGELKIIKAESVVAVIEVKSSITKRTYFSTLKAFEKLNTLRVTNCFLFVYGQLTQRNLSNWLYSYKSSNTCREQDIITDSYLYDWSDMQWLPNSVLSLESNKFFKLGHISVDNGDWLGYTALNIKDSKDANISCIQEFFSDIIQSINNGVLSIDVEKYSIEDVVELFRL